MGRRRDVAEEDAGQGVSALRAAVPVHHQGAAIGQPRINGHGTAAGEHDDRPRIGLADGGDQLGLAPGEIEVEAVFAFLVLIAIEAGDDDGHVGVLGRGDRLVQQRGHCPGRPAPRSRGRT